MQKYREGRHAYLIDSDGSVMELHGATEEQIAATKAAFGVEEISEERYREIETERMGAAPPTGSNHDDND